MPDTPHYLGRYRAERVVGAGAFATVWLAHDETLGAPVAIKVLAENWAHDPEIRERFLEEARILWRADSDHIVRIHNVDELPDGRPYFVMDYADRGTLAGADGRCVRPTADVVGAGGRRGQPRDRQRPEGSPRAWHRASRSQAGERDVPVGRRSPRRGARRATDPHRLRHRQVAGALTRHDDRHRHTSLHGPGAGRGTGRRAQ